MTYPPINLVPTGYIA